jgi:hypothetical protein
VARTIATIGGVALRPGVSRNRRLYTRPMIAKAVASAQERIRDGGKPIVMLSHHGAGDDSRQIVAHLTGVSLDEDGNARYTAAVADTTAGRDIAALIDTSDGDEPHLKGVSIRGFWTGTVRKVRGPDDDPVETGEGLELAGLDFTKDPGVDGAENDTFAWADRSGASETTERVPIFESAEEALVTFTEKTAPAKAEQSCEEMGHTCCKEAAAAPAEALAFIPQPGHVLEDGACVTCAGVTEAALALSKRGSGLSGSGKTYADPGYQSDKKSRYDLSTKQNAKAAWAYINQKSNASKYTSAQLKRIKGRIMAALKRFGVSVSTESAGWTFDSAVQVTEAVAEYFGDPSCAGSWCINATNGPVSISLSSYSMDPSDLDPVLKAAADAACKALATLDPDMDGDIDVPGATASDTDHDGGESAPDDEPETETDPAASPAAAINTKEESEMTDATTPAEQAAPALDPNTLAEAIATALAKRDEDRAAAERAAAEEAAAKAAAEETADARIKRLVAEGLKAALAGEERDAEIEAVTETEDEKVKRLVAEGMVIERQKLAENGVGTDRKGLTTGAVDEHRAPRTDGGQPELNSHGLPSTFPDKDAKDLSATELRRHSAPYLAAYVFGDRAAKFG